MIASARPRTYLPRVPFAPLVRLLTILALLLAPLVMSGGHAAAATGETAAASHHEAMPAGHCTGTEDEDSGKEPRPEIDCTISCSALPAIAGGMAELVPVSAPELSSPAPSPARGLHPEADPPPPRS